LNELVFSLKTTSATRIFINTDVPEAQKLNRYEICFDIYLNFKICIVFLCFLKTQVFRGRIYFKSIDREKGYTRISGGTNVS
jgi:hypothetical protein